MNKLNSFLFWVNIVCALMNATRIITGNGSTIVFLILILNCVAAWMCRDAG